MSLFSLYFSLIQSYIPAETHTHKCEVLSSNSKYNIQHNILTFLSDTYEPIFPLL